MKFTERLRHAWTSFNSGTLNTWQADLGPSYYRTQSIYRMSMGNERTIVASLYNKISIDVAAIKMVHARVDSNGNYMDTINSGLNECLNVEANIDQDGRTFIQNVALNLFDEGVVGLVPVNTDLDPTKTGSYDIKSLRYGKITQWFPDSVEIEVWNNETSNYERIVLPKKIVAIIYNPFYTVMNETNSVAKRLIQKLNLLDGVDEQTSSGKLDIIIQLPYSLKTQTKRNLAEERRKDIEMQLSGSKYGIAYVDATERITQLNRPAENNLLSQIEYLQKMLYSQLGVTQEVFDGTADEQTMLNYYNTTVEPVVAAIVNAMKRTFLTKTARSQGQSILYMRNPFSLSTTKDLAEIADTYTRNEILSSNEMRGIIGYRPVEDPRANELRNKNIAAPNDQLPADVGMMGEMEAELGTEDYEDPDQMTPEQIEAALADLDLFDEDLDSLQMELDETRTVKHYASPYYDPVKAHEYYMEHRELKKRKSTTGLNDEGKSTAAFVKERLDSERKSKAEDHTNRVNSLIETSKANRDRKIESEKKITNQMIDSYKSAMQSQIESLRKYMSQHRKDISEKYKNTLQNRINYLKENNAKQKAKLKETLKTTTGKLREEHSTQSKSLRSDLKDTKSRLKTEYDEKYMQELDKIKAEEQYQKKTKTKTTKSSSKSSGTKTKKAPNTNYKFRG